MRKLLLLAIALVLFATACQGPSGPGGPQGSQGERGAQGPAGAQGAAPSEEQLLQLVRKVVEEKKEELRGPQGPKGDRGSQGQPGPPSVFAADMERSMATDIARLKDDMGVPFIAAIHPGWETLGGMPEDDMLYRTVYVAPGDVLTIRGRGFRANEVLALEESDRTLGGKSVWVKLQTLKATQMGYLELQVSIQQRHLAITRVDGIPLPYVIHVVRQDGSWLYPTNEVFMNEKTGSSR